MVRRQIVRLGIATALALLLSSPANAAAGRAATCKSFSWTDAKTANPTLDDIGLLDCWSVAGDANAGYIRAMLTKAGRGVPADAVSARAQLKVLAEGRRAGILNGTMGARSESYAMDSGNQPLEEIPVLPYPPAMRELAKMMLQGEGGSTDIPGAKAWLEHARPKDKEAGVLLDALKAKGY